MVLMRTEAREIWEHALPGILNVLKLLLRPFLGQNSHLNRSFSIAISHLQQDRSVQARPSVNVAFLVICCPKFLSHIVWVATLGYIE